MVFRQTGFESILYERNMCPYTDNEKQRKIGDNVRLFISSCNSYRYVLYVDNKAVSAMQVMKVAQKEGIIANVITIAEERRKGHARYLFELAKKKFKILRHSKNLSPDGIEFSKNVN